MKEPYWVMKRVFFITALLTFNCFYKVSAQLFQKTFEVNGHVIKVKELNQRIEEILDKTSLPGLSFAIINQDKVVFYNTYGYKKFERLKSGMLKGKGKINKRTLFEACSLSKSFFVFAAHRLIDQKVLDLDTPLYQYLKYAPLEYDERYKKITARMVLTHCSGIENWQSYNDPAKLEIKSEPGADFLYSGEGYVYLSKVIEKLLGESTEKYMKELVYKPLKLKRTFTVFSRNGHRPHNYCLGHNSFMESMHKEKNQFPNIAGLINTTAKDYAQLLIAFFCRNYLSEERLDDITETKIPMGEHNYMGAGFSIYIEKGDTVLYQNGDNGQFKGFGFYSLTRKSGYVMFVNGERGDQIQKILDDLTIQHNIFDKDNQYPNFKFEILNIYNNHGYPASLNRIKSVISKLDSSNIKENLNELGDMFLKKEPELALYIALEYKRRYPSSKDAIILHGRAMMEKFRFQEAINDFKKARELEKASREYLDSLISRCYELIEIKEK